MWENVEDAFKYKKIVLATTTYNMSIFPYMNELLTHLEERNYQNRKIGKIQNGSWAPSAEKTIKDILKDMKDIDIIEPTVTIKSTMKDSDMVDLEKLANNILGGE